VAYLPQIQLAQPTAPPSFGTNLPQSVTHFLQQAIFRHAPGKYKVENIPFSLEFMNSASRFIGRQRDRQAYPPDSLGDK
jgi:hypothetical protein